MARNQIHAVQPNQAADQAILVLAFLVGALGGVALKIFGAPVLATALFPVGVLALYVMACMASRRLAIEPETVGDNCYYLGFLFTLASLATTLYQIRGLEAQTGTASHLIPSVISGFGVALTSTICGVFFRILLMQMRPDIVARDREARRDLAQGARELRLAVAEASRELKSISVEMAQHAAERNARISEITDEHMRQANELVQKQNDQFDRTFNEFSRRLSDELAQALSAGISVALTKLSESANEIAASLQGISGAHAESIGVVREANRDIAQAAVDFKAAMLEHHRVALASYRTLEGRAEKISAALATATENLEQGASQIQRRLASQAKAQDERTEKVIAGFSGFESSLAGIIQKLRDASSQLDAAISSIDNRSETRGMEAQSVESIGPASEDDQAKDRDEAAPLPARRRLMPW